MADTVWSQIVVLFDGFFRSMSLFVVFTVFTSLMSLFLVISFQTPLKNPTRRAGGTKASGFVPPTLRVGFLRGVINEFNDLPTFEFLKMVLGVADECGSMKLPVPE